jgi:tetratricopeptide (TPR) repeat protein
MTRKYLALLVTFVAALITIAHVLGTQVDATSMDRSAQFATNDVLTGPASSRESLPETLPDELRDAFYLAEVANVEEFDAKFDAALGSARDQLRQREQDLGPDHELVGRSLTVLGLLYTTKHDYANAEKVLKRARLVLEKSAGPESLPVSYALAASALYEMQRNNDEHAEDWLKRSLAIREKVLGPDDLEVGDAALALADYYQTKRNFKLANQLYDRVFAVRTKLLPEGDLSTSHVLARQACILRKTNKEREAAELEFRAGVGPQPEYERNGKYKHPEFNPLGGNLRRMSVPWLSPMPTGRSLNDVWARVAISQSGKVIYACSNSSAVPSLIPFMYERIIYRSTFKPTIKDNEPVLAAGSLTLYNRDSSPLMVIPPSFPGTMP